MRGDGTPNKFTIIGAVIFILLIGAIFFALSGNLFGHAEEDTRPKVAEVTTDRSVRMTVDGPIVSNEERESYRITVGYERRIAEGMSGYKRSVVATQTFDNNSTAYTEFVNALSRAGYDKRRDVTDEAADPRGVCPAGQRYTFEILDSGRVIDTAWTSTCSNARGNMTTQGSKLKKLFDDQIKDLEKVIAPVTL